MQSPQVEPPANRQTQLYEIDFYAWTQEQAKLLSQHQWHQLDLPNLIEEIESLGKQQRSELRNRLSILIGHLLKWEYQPDRRSRSWLAALRIERYEVQDLLEDNPSLQPYLQEVLQRAFESGRDLASGETNLALKTFPQDCPYELAEILSDRFFPGEPPADELTD